jgi:phospholipase D3/4
MYMNAYLVESIPWGLEELRGVEGVAYTEEVLLRLVEGARGTIDLMAMYWSLLTDSDAPDEEGVPQERLAALGADHGRRLFRALEEAVRRGVRLRVVGSPGFREGPSEAERLASMNPALVEVRSVDMRTWYGAGIMHQKLWLVDRHSFYLGSANTDWRSLTQVKELGVVVENHPALAADLGRHFDGWWHLAGLPHPSVKSVWDPAVELERRVPAWSGLVPEEGREPSPLDRPAYRADYDLSNPAPLVVGGRPGGAFVSGSPPELCGPGRTVDLDALLHTVRDARESVCVSVMTYYPGGRYPRAGEEEETFVGIWWPVLSDALLRAAVTRGLSVRLLVAHWAHTGEAGLELLRALGQIADAATAEEFVVTDRRLHVSTSNLTWGYFTHTAGCSFNTDQPELVDKAQELFDRDWGSPYAHPLDGREGTGLSEVQGAG